MKGHRIICWLITAFANCFAENVFAEIYNAVIDRIDLDNHMEIENFGTINEIHTNGYNLTVLNHGTIGKIYNYDDAYINQKISNQSMLNKIVIENADEFVVNVDGVKDGIDLNVLQNITADATSVVINNSSIIIDDFADWRNWNQDVSLTGVNTLYVRQSNTINSGEPIKFLTDNGTHIVLLDADKTSKVTLSNDTGASSVDVNQDSDVSKLFDDKRKDVLQEIQDSDTNNNLLKELNEAQGMQEVERIMHTSYQFNPIILMRPIKTINQFYLSDFLSDEGLLYGGLSGVYIVSDTTSGFGLNFDIKGKYKDLYLGASLHVNQFQYKNYTNNFKGVSYGADIKIKKYIDKFWIHGIAGLSLVNYKTGTIYHDEQLTRNPFGYSEYVALDTGYDYEFSSDLMFSPFVGFVLQNYRVMKIDDNDTDMRFGGKVKYSFVIDGIRYIYSGMFGATVDSNVFGKIGIGFISEQDKAGVSLDLDVLKNDYDVHYKISLNGKISF